MCEQEGTAKIRNLGIVFGAAAQQPDSVRTKDRWTIANTGNYYTTFGSDATKPNPTTFSTSTAWFNNGVNSRVCLFFLTDRSMYRSPARPSVHSDLQPVSVNYPFGQNMRACTGNVDC